jgi:hypothetical protein
VNDPLSSALAEALEPLVRRLVDDAVRRAELEWRWRTSEQAAELLGITPAAIRQRTNRGQLRAYKFDGRNYYDVHELDAAIRDGRYSESQLHPDQKWPRRCANSPRPDAQGGNP